MKMKVLTANIWRYYEWEKRKEKLIDFLKKENADIDVLCHDTSAQPLQEKLVPFHVKRFCGGSA